MHAQIWVHLALAQGGPNPQLVRMHCVTHIIIKYLIISSNQQCASPKYPCRPTTKNQLVACADQSRPAKQAIMNRYIQCVHLFILVNITKSTIHLLGAQAQAQSTQLTSNASKHAAKTWPQPTGTSCMHKQQLISTAAEPGWLRNGRDSKEIRPRWLCPGEAV